MPTTASLNVSVPGKTLKINLGWSVPLITLLSRMAMTSSKTYQINDITHVFTGESHRYRKVCCSRCGLTLTGASTAVLMGDNKNTILSAVKSTLTFGKCTSDTQEHTITYMHVSPPEYKLN